MFNKIISVISGTYGLIKINKHVEIFYDPNNTSCFIAKTWKNIMRKDIIIVDDIFMSLENDIQEAIVYHELGHINSKKNCGNIRYNITNEILADIYVLNNVGKKRTLKMLYTVKSILTYNNKKTKEIDIRIDFIKKYGFIKNKENNHYVCKNNK